MHDESGSPSAADRRLATLLGAYRLKDEPRRGWVLRGVDRPESVAAHSWGTALLCLVFAEEAGVDVGRALAVATAHDVAEAELGDIPARARPEDREVDVAEKARLEAAALARLLSGELEGVGALWREYEEGASPEARFVRDMNLLDMALQALVYEEQARYDPSRPLSSRGDHRHLDEFFVSAETRVQRRHGWGRR
ncbi:MAG: HD domain-containing protein [Deinococcales bacterium]